MKITRLLVCVLPAALVAFSLLFSSNDLAAQLATKTGFTYLQDKNRRQPHPVATPPEKSAAQRTSGLVIRPSFRISETSTILPNRAPGSPEVAYNPDDNEYLVVWESDGLTELKGVNDIYGQRLNASTGDSAGIGFRISTLTDENKNHGANSPRVVYNRTSHEYLVVWFGSGLYGAPDRFFEVFGQRLDRTGKVIGTNFRISHTADLGKVNTNFVRSSGPCDVAWNSTTNEYLVVWKGMGEPEDVVKMEIYGQRLKASGELFENYFRISHTTNQGKNFHAGEPAIAYNDRANQYFVVWTGTYKNESQTEVFGVGLSAIGKVLSGTHEMRVSQVTDVGPDRAASSPQVVYNSANTEYFVVFQANALRGEGNANTYEIFGQRIDAGTLTEIGENDLRVSKSMEIGNLASEPTIAFNSAAKEYFVTWLSSRQDGTSEIYGQRIVAAGAEIEANVQISNIAALGKDRSVEKSTLTPNTRTGEYFVVWKGNAVPDKAAKLTEIFGQRVSLASSQQ
jgi:hypothetical protein